MVLDKASRVHAGETDALRSSSLAESFDSDDELSLFDKKCMLINREIDAMVNML